MNDIDLGDSGDAAESSATAGLRLDRCVAELTGCSRREAAQYIEGGWVTVDGEVVETPQSEINHEIVALLPGAKAEESEPATFLLHKPAGITIGEAIALASPGNRADDDPFRMRALQRHFVRRSAPLPLSANASGLMVLTQDAKLLRRLNDEADRIEHELNVEVSGEIAMYGMARLNHGLGDLAPRPLPTAKVSWQNETTLRFAMKAWQPGQVEAMCTAVGLQVVAIRRIRIGRISMAKLPVGQWRYMARHERF